MDRRRILEGLVISPDVARSLVDHAQREAPAECCGLLAGREEVIDRHYPLPNASREPTERYFAEPQALVDAIRQIRESGRELLGIYHSHPRSAPEPSAMDIEQALYPDCAYFIIGGATWAPGLRAFRISDGKAEPLEFSWMEP